MTQKEIDVKEIIPELSMFHEINEHINFLFDVGILDDETYSQLKTDNCDKLDKFLKERGIFR